MWVDTSRTSQGDLLQIPTLDVRRQFDNFRPSHHHDTPIDHSPLLHDASHYHPQDVPRDSSHVAPGAGESVPNHFGGVLQLMICVIQKEDQAGHTISQRLRKIKQIPLELYPLAVVVGFALVAAGYSCVRKFVVDKNLRLARQGPAAREDH
ncbi:hypothetical protein ACRE_004570 [Hapsidospora chrysogenum ATCC 11550]|uniref:Uncharacterized protein n=1 Tax=Hapsidospora chrysogenum (strain ATCC 11550 / CBS 779.69 / DSM 880 / IAM 14645 / JCM 23072 / IMI 49137) TaxID=857340 RepID=A0A086TGY8_HAPC1|nr:hypothetical protein ACRE_004570 [Hapsidospora chrysogenum ATCC 11550]